jgi:predicted nucleotidyltransferase
MLITEFTDVSSDFSLDQAVVFHDELNPKIFSGDTMKPEIRDGLLKIAEHFADFIGVELDIVDITISGSNAAFSYTPESDIDLHIVVKVPDDEAYKHLLDAKKNVYNAEHDILVKGIDVELYAQNSEEEHHSLGIYSVLNDEWVDEPKKQEITIDSEDVQSKYKNYRDRIDVVLDQDRLTVAQDMAKDIKRMRQSGLSSKGEFSTENLAFKLLRKQGWIDKLYAHIKHLQDQELSIEQRLGI